MLLWNVFYLHYVILVYAFFISPVLTDGESKFSQGCYSACPRKIWTLESSSRQEIDKQWIKCLKQCHEINSWTFIVIVCAIVLVIGIVCVVIDICWGQKIKLKYTFHKQRKKRASIRSQDQAKIKTFEEALKNFKQLMTVHFRSIYIEFENDIGHKKKFFIDDAIFHERKNNDLQNMFSVILFSKKQKLINPINNLSEIQDNSQNQIKNVSQIQQNEYSQLIGAVSFTNKGLNIWWIKIDDKPQEGNQCCRFFSKRNKKYLAVYEKDPFAPENTFIGNVVLEDSSKKAEQRYTNYVIKRKEQFEIPHFVERVIET